MIGRILILFWVEWNRAARSWQTYLGPVAVFVAVVAALWVYPVARDRQSDYAYLAYAVPASLNLLGFLLTLLFSATLMSADLGSGALRLVLTRPVRRTELLLAKLLLAFAYALSLGGVAALTAWLIAANFGDLQGVYYGGELLFTSTAMARGYAIAVLLSLAPQCAGAAMALFFSVCTRSQLGALSLALAAWFTLDLAKYPLNLEAYVFTTYLETPWRIFSVRTEGMSEAWLPDAAYGLGTSLLSILVFTTLAAWIFRLRDLGR